MKLTYIPLLVSDFPAAVRFWSETAKLPLTYNDETMGFASFDTGRVTLLLLSHSAFAQAGGEGASQRPQVHSMYLSFQVDNVDDTYTDLIAGGATSVYAPRDFPNIQARQAHLHDPDGHLIEIYSPFPKN